MVSTFDSNGKEVILMGKGIGFRKKTGDELDKTKIEKIFTLDLSGKSSFVQEVMAIIQEFYEIVLDTEHIRDLQHIYNILRRKSYQRNAR